MENREFLDHAAVAQRSEREASRKCGAAQEQTTRVPQGTSSCSLERLLIRKRSRRVGQSNQLSGRKVCCRKRDSGLGVDNRQHLSALNPADDQALALHRNHSVFLLKNRRSLPHAPIRCEISQPGYPFPAKWTLLMLPTGQIETHGALHMGHLSNVQIFQVRPNARRLARPTIAREDVHAERSIRSPAGRPARRESAAHPQSSRSRTARD